MVSTVIAHSWGRIRWTDSIRLATHFFGKFSQSKEMFIDITFTCTVCKESQVSERCNSQR